MKTVQGPRAASAASLLLECPACGGQVALPPAEAFGGRRAGCLHCGTESWLDRAEADGSPGPWVLVPDEPEERA